MTERSYLFAVWDGGGNLPPMLALGAQMAQLENVKVTMLGPPSLRETVERHQAHFVPVAGPPVDLVKEDMGADMDAFTRYIAGADAAREILSVIDAESPDVIVADCMYFAALTAAEKSEVPTATFVHLRYGFFTEEARDSINAWLGTPAGAARAELKLSPFDPDESFARQAWDAGATTLSMLSPDLESPMENDPRQLLHVGPIFDAPVEPRDDGPPVIVVSFSTTQMGQGGALQNVLDAVAGLDARVICTTGGVDVGDLRAPSNTEVVPWMAHAELLPRASVVVTHAGMGTTLAALAHGVPIVAMPMGRDQDGNAVRLSELGVGVNLAPTASVAEITAAVGEVLDRDSFAKVARRMRRELGQFDNGALAVSSLGWM